LCARKEDIPLLLDRFLEKHCRNEGKNLKSVSPDVKDLFISYNWPGNVRELENTVEYMAGMEPGEIISMDRVPARIKRKRPDMVSPDMPLDALLQKYEEDLLRQKLAELGDLPGKKEILADKLQVSRATLYRKLKKLGIQ
jgi:transcriptional regulator with PAS, ATPase and Fis domain